MRKGEEAKRAQAPICHIVGAMPTSCSIKKEAGELLIAADAGYAQLPAGLRPDMVVGDFDSLPHPPAAGRVIRHPVRKDDTDSMLAVKLGLEAGYTRFILYGCLGGKLGHTLANIQALAYLLSHKAAGVLAGDAESLLLMERGSLRLAGEAGRGLSVFAYGGQAEGLSLSGLSYPLQDALLQNDFPLGVSNAFTQAEARIRLRQGRLLVLWEGAPDALAALDGLILDDSAL